MDKKYLKKIIAQSPLDLKMISACCSEAKLKLSDIKYLPKNKLFLISIERLNKEIENKSEKINSIIKFEKKNINNLKIIDLGKLLPKEILDDTPSISIEEILSDFMCNEKSDFFLILSFHY